MNSDYIDIKRSKIASCVSIIYKLIVIIVVAAILIKAFEFSQSYIILGSVVLAIIAIAHEVAVNAHHSIKIYDDRIAIKLGVFSKQILEIPLNNLSGSSFLQTYPHKILNYGAVLFNLKDGSAYMVNDIAAPNEVQAQLWQKVDAHPEVDTEVLGTIEIQLTAKLMKVLLGILNVFIFIIALATITQLEPWVSIIVMVCTLYFLTKMTVNLLDKKLQYNGTAKLTNKTVLLLHGFKVREYRMVYLQDWHKLLIDELNNVLLVQTENSVNIIPAFNQLSLYDTAKLITEWYPDIEIDYVPHISY